VTADNEHISRRMDNLPPPSLPLISHRLRTRVPARTLLLVNQYGGRQAFPARKRAQLSLLRVGRGLLIGAPPTVSTGAVCHAGNVVDVIRGVWHIPEVFNLFCIPQTLDHRYQLWNARRRKRRSLTSFLFLIQSYNKSPATWSSIERPTVQAGRRLDSAPNANVVDHDPQTMTDSMTDMHTLGSKFWASLGLNQKSKKECQCHMEK